MIFMKLMYAFAISLALILGVVSAQTGSTVCTNLCGYANYGGGYYKAMCWAFAENTKTFSTPSGTKTWNYVNSVSADNDCKAYWNNPNSRCFCEGAASQMPAAPTNVRASVDSCSGNTATIRITWTDNSNNENNFLVKKWHLNVDNDWVLIGTVSANSNSFTWNSAVANAYYAITVGAQNSAGTSYPVDSHRFIFKVTCATQPDLIIEPRATEPLNPVAGNPVTFSAVVKNIGGAAAGSSATRFRLDIGKDGTWNVQQVISTGSLAINGMETETWSRVWLAREGEHKFEICADINNAVAESDETNNCTPHLSISVPASTTTSTTTTTSTSSTTSSSSTTLPPGACSGNIILALNPSSVQPSGIVTFSASGLANCNGKLINLRQNSCSGTQINSCTSQAQGCSGTFNAPSPTGTYNYFACIDKNNDNDFTDFGESALANIIVSTSATTTSTTTTSTTSTTAQPAACSNECLRWGQRECSGSGYRVCGNLNGDNCFEWGQVVNCPSGTVCSSGFCATSSDPTSTTSSTTTTTSTTTSTSTTTTSSSTSTSSSSSTTSSSSTSSTAGSSTTSSTSSTSSSTTSSTSSTSSTTSSTTTTTDQPSTCSNDCIRWGQRECSGNSYRVCGNFDGDSCFEWSSFSSCTSGQTCIEGFCFPSATASISNGSGACSNQCSSGQKRCSSNSAVEICGNFDSDSCLEYGFDQNCRSDQLCINSECVKACDHECSPQGLTGCDGPNVYMFCGNFDDDPCNEWTRASCGRSEKCLNNRCVGASSQQTPPGASEPVLETETRTIISEPEAEIEEFVSQEPPLDFALVAFVIILILAVAVFAFNRRRTEGEEKETRGK